jgi:hypothetical protein
MENPAAFENEAPKDFLSDRMLAHLPGSRLAMYAIWHALFREKLHL